MEQACTICKYTKCWCYILCACCTPFYALCIYVLCSSIYTTVAVHACIHYFKFLLFLYKQLLSSCRILEYRLWHIYTYNILWCVFLCIHLHTMKIIYIIFIKCICLYTCALFATCLCILSFKIRGLAVRRNVY